MARISKYLNQTKTINDVVFSTITYFQNKVEVIAEGYEGSFWIGTQTWKKYVDGGSSTKRSSFHPSGKKFLNVFKKITKEVKEVVEKVTNKVKEYFFETPKTEEIETPKLTELFPMPLLLPAPQSDLEFLQNFVADILSKEVENISEKEIEEIREEKDVYSLFVFLFSDCKKENSKKYYRILATRLHPDKHKHGNEQWFKYLQEVYNWAKERGYAL